MVGKYGCHGKLDQLWILMMRPMDLEAEVDKLEDSGSYKLIDIKPSQL